MNYKSLIFLLFLSIQSVIAQQKKDVLFTVSGDKVYADEFLKVFNKNRDIVTEENKKSLDDYLELFINYKLKLKQAYDLKYDTVTAYKKELATYREQLTIPYLSDSEVTEKLIKEAYDRTKTEIHASHILIRLPENPTPEDTLKAYQRVKEARDKVVSKHIPFEKVAVDYSEDPSVKVNGGDLGYFSAFTMVYPFENAAYNTPEGEVSLPFRTQFGYHIVKNKGFQASKGEVEVAHIMLMVNPKDSTEAETKINELYTKLQQGDAFEFLVRMHSDDKRSAVNEGRLPKFNEHKMIEPFSSVAFSLKEPGDYSKPFKTPYGWHIVKLVKFHPTSDFESMKQELATKIANDERALKAGESVFKRLLKKYRIIENKELIKNFEIDDDLSKQDMNATILQVNEKEYALGDLIDYKNTSRRKQFSKEQLYKTFRKDKVLDYYKENLEKENKDFAFTYQEYKDGLLLFNILQDKVWKFAETDTVGLKEFFNKHREKYMWPKRAKVIIATCSKEEKARKVKTYLEDKTPLDSIKNKVNESPIIHVLFTKGIMEEGHKKLPEGFTFTKVGVSQVIPIENANFAVVEVEEILESMPMEFNEAKGRITNDYQQYVEEQWIKNLRNTYSVKVNNRTLKKLKKQNPDD